MSDDIDWEYAYGVQSVENKKLREENAELLSKHDAQEFLMSNTRESLDQKLMRLAEKWLSVSIERDFEFRNGLWECIVDNDTQCFGAEGTTPTEAVDNLIRKIEDKE